MRPVCGLNIRRYVNSIFNSNTYLITYGREAVLVDCGDVLEICHECRDNGIDIKAILLTHSHFDHIYGLNILLEEFKDITVYTTTVGRESLFSDKLNLSRYHESPFVFEGRENNDNSRKFHDNSYMARHRNKSYSDSWTYTMLSFLSYRELSILW